MYRGGSCLLHLPFFGLFSRLIPTVLFWLFAGFGRLSLFSFVFTFVGLPLWVSTLRLDIGDFLRIAAQISSEVLSSGVLSKHSILYDREGKGCNCFCLE